MNLDSNNLATQTKSQDTKQATSFETPTLMSDATPETTCALFSEADFDEITQHQVVLQLQQSLHLLQSQLGSTSLITVWLACSGGRDSLGLLLAFALLKKTNTIPHGINVKVIHINHQLQGQAATWQQLVEDFCSAHNFACISKKVQLTHGSENEARNARYQAIYDSIQANDVIVLGHHADDQAETVLMNLCKGTGLAGLAGMSVLAQHNHTVQQDCMQSSQLSSSYTKLPHWRFRPWLNVTREQITEFCSKANLVYVDDPTNVDGDNTRAFIRRELMPMLNKQWPKANANIARSASIVADAKSIVMQQAHADLDTCLQAQNELDVTLFAQLTKERQLSALVVWLQQDAVSIQQHLIQQTILLAQADQQYIADTQTRIVFKNIQIRRYKNTLYKLPIQLATAQNKTFILSKLTGSVVSLECADFAISPDVQVGFDSSLLEQKLLFRAPLAGEKLHIVGRVGRWPLKKFFQSISLAPWQRTQVYIVCCNDEPIAILYTHGVYLVHSSYYREGLKTQEAKMNNTNSKTITSQNTDKHCTNSQLWNFCKI